ncbi:MAG TPA: hypothetical protein PKZ76_05460 [Xanthomonadaceae bacterium]|nr:hypothetical protein [Xanthomonadaceae bacterium]
MSHLPAKLAPRFEARKRYRLTDAQVQMARELGMPPHKLGALADHRQQPWKLPLPEFIEACYMKHFGRAAPEQVRSLEEVIAADARKRQAKRERKAARASTAPKD